MIFETYLQKNKFSKNETGEKMLVKKLKEVWKFPGIVRNFRDIKSYSTLQL